MQKSKSIRQVVKYNLENIPPVFRECLQNRFTALATDYRPPEELWADIKKVMLEASERIFYRQQKESRPKLLTEETWNILKKHRKAKVKRQREGIIELNQRFQLIARKGKEKYYNDMCKQIESENIMGRTQSAFMKLNELKKNFKSRIAND